MAADPSLTSATTTDAVAATVQSRQDGAEGAEAKAATAAPVSPDQGNQHDCAGAGTLFDLGPALYRAMNAPHQRWKGEPLYRPLRIYTVDPAAARLDGAIGVINVPYEPLAAGPVGSLFEVDNNDGDLGLEYRRADLEHPDVLITDGYTPSPSDPRFHQQMVYAVCANTYSAFRTALGRNLTWGFGEAPPPAPATAPPPTRLVLRPHYSQMQNAFYRNERATGSLCFGYYPAADKTTDGSLPGGYVFTCLSHDIVAHEVTHALLDGMRAHFAVPSGPDVAAFHEAFADLVAIFQHFSYREVVVAALRRWRGALEKADLLKDVARQFGHTTGQGGPLRTAIETDLAHPSQYDETLEPHLLGSVLVSAIFDAFITIFKRKTERYIRLATNGTGVLPPGELSHDLQLVLADKASTLASQFLTVCIRAIDYCPPVGINFGDYLRALITADCDVVPDDPWDYRGALIDAFSRRNIYPRYVTSLSVDALVWRGPRKALPNVPGLAFGELHFKGDPANAFDAAELRKQACALGRYVVHEERLAEFGLVVDGDPDLNNDHVDRPFIESIRTARRAGPDGQIVFDLVAEITQVRHVEPSAAGSGFDYHGGCTVILGPDGEVRYLVTKSVTGRERLERRRAFLASEQGRRLWQDDGQRFTRVAHMFELLHQPRAGAQAQD